MAKTKAELEEYLNDESDETPGRGGTGSVSLDFTGIEEFGAIPDGLYDATVFAVEPQRAKSNDNPFLKWTFALQDPQYPNRKMFHNTSLLPQSRWVVKQLLTALGVPTEGVVELNFRELLGLPCRLQLTTEMYEGEPRNKVKKVFPAGSEAAESDTL